MEIKIKIAQYFFIDQIISLFENNLSDDNDAVYNDEFYCPYGIRKALRAKQIVIATTTMDNKVIGAARFYPRKLDNVISLYQFAVDKAYRHQKVMTKILDFLSENQAVESMCPVNSGFNNYYKNSGWKLLRSNDEFNIWRYYTGGILVF